MPKPGDKPSVKVTKLKNGDQAVIILNQVRAGPEDPQAAARREIIKRDMIKQRAQGNEQAIISYMRETSEIDINETAFEN